MPNSPTNMLQIPMLGGLSDNVDDRVKPLGSFQDIVNTVVDKRGSIQKRSGYGEIDNAAFLYNVSGDAFSHNGRLSFYGTSVSGPTGQSWRGYVGGYIADQEFTFANPGPFVVGNVYYDDIAKQAGAAQVISYVKTTNDWTGVVWLGYVQSAATGTTIGIYLSFMSPEGVALNTNRVLGAVSYGGLGFGMNTKIAYVGINTTSNQIRAGMVDTDGVNASDVTVDTTVAKDAVSGAYAFDANKINEDYFIVAYKTGATAYRVKIVDCSGGSIANGAFGSFTTTDTIVSLAVCGDRDTADLIHVYVATEAGGTMTLRCTTINSSTFAVVVAPTVVFTYTGTIVGHHKIGCEYNVTSQRSVCVFFEVGEITLRIFRFTNAGVASQLESYHDGFPQNKPIVSYTAAEFFIATTISPYATATDSINLLNDSSYNTVGYFNTHKSAQGIASPLSATAHYVDFFYFLPKAHLTNNSASISYFLEEDIYIGALTMGLPPGISMQYNLWRGSSLVSLFRLRLENYNNVNCSADNGTLFSGMSLIKYDGVNTINVGFIQQPSLGNVSQADAAGTAVGVGTYKYRAAYEYTDGTGAIHRSALGPIITVVVTVANRIITMEVTRHDSAQKPFSGDAINPCGIVVYRTLAGGSVFHRLGNVWGYQQVLSKTTGTTPVLTFEDEQGDALIQNNPVTYEDLGELAPIAPPPPYHVIEAKNRVFIISNEEPSRIWFSKYLSTYGEQSYAPEFNPVLTIEVAGASQPLTALASMDDKVLAFTADKIFFISGDGPNNAGTGSFSGPFQIASDVGCIDRRSVISYPEGVFFRSKAGMHFVDRSLTVTFVGESIKNSIVDDPNKRLVGLLNTKEQRAIWLQQDVGDASGYFVVYDYDNKFWSRWSVDLPTTPPPMSHAIIDNKHIIQQGSRTYIAGFGSHPGYDPGGYIPMILVTPWIYVSSIGGYQRIRRLIIEGRANSYHILQIKVYYDYSAVASQTYSFIIQPATIAEYPVIRIQQELVVQKCQAMQIEIQDFEYVALGQPAENPNGLNIFGISLETIAKEGRVKLPYQNRK